MPGRGGRQRIKKKASKREPPTAMDKTLLDSIYGRRRKEREILQGILLPRLPELKRKVGKGAPIRRQQAAEEGGEDSAQQQEEPATVKIISVRPPVLRRSSWAPSDPAQDEAARVRREAAAQAAERKGIKRKVLAEEPTAASTEPPASGKKAAKSTKPTVPPKQNDDAAQAASGSDADDGDVDPDEVAGVEDEECADAVAVSFEVADIADVKALAAFLGLKTSRGVLVAYSTWCPRCSKLVPQFMAAVAALKEQGTIAKVRFAAVDVERVRDAADELGVDELPTVVFFDGGAEVDRVEGPKATLIRTKIVEFMA